MSLFICSICKAVENTALGAYWSHIDKPLCSECGGGEWHGRFDKETYDEKRWKKTEHGSDFIERI